MCLEIFLHTQRYYYFLSYDTNNFRIAYKSPDSNATLLPRFFSLSQVVSPVTCHLSHFFSSSIKKNEKVVELVSGARDCYQWGLLRLVFNKVPAIWVMLEFLSTAEGFIIFVFLRLPHAQGRVRCARRVTLMS